MPGDPAPRSVNPSAILEAGESPVTFDRASGRILLFGMPALFTFPEFYLDLQGQLEETTGRAAKGILYRVSYLAGQRAAGILGGPLEESDGPAGLEARLPKVVDFVLLTGFGNIVASIEDASEAATTWTLPDSFIAQLRPPNGAVVCHVYAGFLAGILSGTLGRPIACTEVACCAKGDEACVFRTEATRFAPV